jgi:hypothetical protein
MQTSYLQAKHIPWRFCGHFASILQTSTTFAKSKLWDSSERKKTNWVRMEDSVLPPTHSHTHKWNFKTLKNPEMEPCFLFHGEELSSGELHLRKKSVDNQC